MFNVMLFTLSLLLPASVMPEEIDNPEYKRWSGFKVGTSVTLETVNETHKMKMTTTTTLKSLNDKELVLESKTRMVVSGQEIEQPAQSRSVPAKIKKVAVKGGAKKPETGKETLKVQKKDVACTWTKTVIEAAGSKTTSKVWMSDKVPGGLVKMESETSGTTKMKTTQKVVSYVIK